MFGIRSLPGKSDDDPLQSRRSAVAWFNQLPPLDVMARAALATEALAQLRQSGNAIDRDRISAIGYLDAAMESDLRTLVAWYLENEAASPRLAERFWQAAQHLNKAFIQAFEAAADQASAVAGEPRWKPVVPLLIAELIRCYGVDSKLRLFRGLHWIPAQWARLHALYSRSIELGIEHVPAIPDHIDPMAPEHTIEDEYLYVLLVHQLDTGNFAPGEIEWASVPIREWSRGLTLSAFGATPEGFVVDLKGSSGLVRRTSNNPGTMIRYLDTTPMVRRIENGLVEAMRARRDLPVIKMTERQRQIVILEKLRVALLAKRPSDYRRLPRVPVNIPTEVHAGLTRICAAIADIEEDDKAAAATPAPSGSAESDWRIVDISAAGWRLSTSDTVGRDLALGTLLAARQADTDDWMLGVVRRVNNKTKGRIEAGVALMASRVYAVTLHAQLHAQDEMSFVVDGVDTSTIGARSFALYPLPPQIAGVPIAMRTLILPTTEYEDGRRMILVTGRTDYKIVLRHLIDRHAEWIWVSMQIVSRAQRT